MFGELILFLCPVVLVSVWLLSEGTKMKRNVLVELVIACEMKEKLGFVFHFLNLVVYIKLGNHDGDK